MKPITTLAAAILSLITGGCFSHTIRHGILWAPTEHKPTPTEATLAAAADIVTLPIQAPLLAVAAHGESGRKATEQQATYLRQIRADPGIIFAKELYRSYDTPGWRAVEEALRDPAIPFTDAQIRRLYREMDMLAEPVLANPYCSPAFLREVLASIERIKSRWEEMQLTGLLANPQLPRDCLETIAADPTRFGRFSPIAQQRLTAPPP